MSNIKKNILAIGYTFRTVDNFLPLLQELNHNGNSVRLALFPNLNDTNHLRMKSFKEIGIIYERPIEKLNDWLAPSFDEICKTLKTLLRKWTPEIIFVDDILNYPSNAILPALLELNLSSRPLVIAFQHGFDQHWHCYNRNFACDYFFSYGPIYRSYFKDELKSRVFPTGLCKIDRLKSVSTNQSGYILFAAQDKYSMAPLSASEKINCYEEIEKILNRLSEFYGLSIVIKPHPSYCWPRAFNSNFNVVGSNFDPIKLIAQANFVITTGSTLALESLSLRKKSVILPSKTGCAFRDSPILATSYDYYGVKQILDNYSSIESKLNGYLDSVLCNWNNFNATSRSIEALQHILSNNGSRPQDTVYSLPPIFSLQRLVKNANRRYIYIWGTGKTGRSLLTYLKKHQFQIEGFIDSDPNKVGKRVDNLHVYNLSYIINLMRTGKMPYILIGSSYVKEIEIILKKNRFRLIEDYQPVFPVFEYN